jgi:hypothetical protein
MRIIADKIIGDHQSCSIKNRRINVLFKSWI